jgi:two-component system response regulator MprA
VLPAPGKATVLVVEDDAALRGLYKTVLTLEGYLVVTAEDGIDALRRIDDHAIDAVVLDLALPRLSGHDVSRELASHQSLRDIPIVIVTGSDAAGVDPADFACVLRKPFSPDALVKAVKDCLRKRGLIDGESGGEK